MCLVWVRRREGTQGALIVFDHVTVSNFHVYCRCSCILKRLLLNWKMWCAGSVELYTTSLGCLVGLPEDAFVCSGNSGSCCAGQPNHGKSAAVDLKSSEGLFEGRLLLYAVFGLISSCPLYFIEKSWCVLKCLEARNQCTFRFKSPVQSTPDWIFLQDMA